MGFLYFLQHLAVFLAEYIGPVMAIVVVVGLLLWGIFSFLEAQSSK